MKEKPYHHGDLRRALIETGIDFIKQKGEEALSLRKIAEICGVSNAAPYAHFKSKDEFIVAIQRYIMDLFAATLEKTVMEYKDSPSLLPMLGKTYVMFFYQNPFYFEYLFSCKNIRFCICENCALDKVVLHTLYVIISFLLIKGIKYSISNSDVLLPILGLPFIIQIFILLLPLCTIHLMNLRRNLHFRCILTVSIHHC